MKKIYKDSIKKKNIFCTVATFFKTIVITIFIFEN